MAARTFYRGGASLTPTPGDVRVDTATGLLRPTHGISVHDRPDGLERFGGAYQLDSIPGNLRIVQRGLNPHHYEIVPTYPMTADEYEQALRQVQMTAV